MQIPKFEAYYASTNDMSPEQIYFYNYLENEIRNKKYPDVQGNISYLFVYTYSILHSAGLLGKKIFTTKE